MSDDPYASHLPVLGAMFRLYRIRRVLEFGAGIYSTKFFLTQPVELLTSVERNREWAERVQTDDPRHNIRRTPPNPDDFDLVFVDDGETAGERLRTLRWVLRHPHPPVVLHDAEVYRKAIADVPHFLYTDLIPHTAVIWP